MSYLEEKPHIGFHTKSKASHNSFVKSFHKQGKKNDVFCKTIVNPEVLTKKQRAKLIQSSNDESKFAFDVFYSLNRKYRWQEISGADDLIAMDAHVLPQQIQLEGSNVATCFGKKRMVQTHFEREADGSVVETTNHEPALGAFDRVIAKKHKQKVIKGMAPALREFGKADESGTEVSTSPVVRYLAATRHPAPHVYGYDLCRGTVSMASDSGKYDNDDDYYSDDYDSEFENDADCVIDEATSSVYSAPKQTFSLADFVVKKNQSVTPSKSENSIDFIEDAQDLIDDFKTKPTTDKNVEFDQLHMPFDPFFREVDYKWKKSFRNSTFVTDFETLNTPQHTFRWLNTEKTSCIVDLTKRLDLSAKTTALLVVFELIPCRTNRLRVLISGSFPCPEDLSLRVLRRLPFTSPIEFIDRIVVRSQKTFDKDHEFLKRVIDITEYQSVYYPDQFTHSSCIDRATVLSCPQVAEISTESNDATDFEFLNDETFDNAVTPHQTCYTCGNDDILTFSVFDGCNHTFCRSCVRSELTTAVANRSQFPLKCLNTECMAPIRPEILYAILPLPVVKFYYRSAFKAEASVYGQKTIRCPGCRNFLNMKIDQKYDSIACGNCPVSFCLKCFKRPHFPLNCSQFAQWNEKFALQSLISDTPKKLITKCRCGAVNFIPKKFMWNYNCVGCDEKYYYHGKNGFQTFPGYVTLEEFSHPNIIAMQYYEVCAPLFKSRFRASTAFDFKKYCLSGMELSQRDEAVTVRKLALHMLELGFAWLYLNRGENPTIWNDVKAQLTQLHIKMDEINVIVEQRVVLRSTAEKVYQMIEIVKNLMRLFTDI